MSKHLSVLIAALCGCILLACSTGDAKADRRIALVVGNANYGNPSLVLSNPKNDAEDVATALRALGFEVVQAIDTNKRDLDLSMAKFARLATNSDAALFYYAGHALQYQGRNYLMPIDAEVEDEVSLRYQMMPVDDVRAALDRASGVKVMILDACRNNPVVESLRRKAGGESRGLGGARGLARIDKTQGTVIAYSTAADEVAADGQGRNSPFTTAFLKRLSEPGLEIEQLFRRVAADVNSATGGRQRPETYVSLLSDYYLNQTDRTAFDGIKDSADPAALRDFIARFPTSSYASDARYRIQRIEIEAQEKQLQQARQQEAVRLLEQQNKTDQEAAARKVNEQRLQDERAKLAEAERLRLEREAVQPAQDQQHAKIARVETPSANQDQPGTPARRVEELPKLAGVERLDLNNPNLQNTAPAAESPKAATEATQQSSAPSSSKSCDQDGAKLARLRSGASLEEVVQFEAGLSCDRLRPQVARLRESLSAGPASAAPVTQAPKSLAAVPPASPVTLQSADKPAKAETANPAEHLPDIKSQPKASVSADPTLECKRDEARLTRLRANPALADIVAFERELGCEKLRPQLARMRESLAPVGPGSRSGPDEGDGSSAKDPPSQRRAERSPTHITPPASTPDQKPAQQVASLPPPEVAAEIAKSVKSELRRVGCFTGSIDGEWNAASRRSLDLFNKHAGTKLDVRLASLDALDAIKLKPARVCPLVCEHGFKADGERCSRIVCAEGASLNNDNECEKRRARTPTARRGADERPDGAGRAQARPEAGPAKRQVSGQIVCDDRGCRPVAPGCHLEFKATAEGGPREGGGGNVQVCK
jgi:uncharacterized caspase-like protein